MQIDNKCQKKANKQDNQRKRPYIQEIFYLESRFFFLPSEGMSKKKKRGRR